MKVGKRETMPGYLLPPATASTAGERPTRASSGGLTAEQFDVVFPIWSAQYPGRTAVVR